MNTNEEKILLSNKTLLLSTVMALVFSFLIYLIVVLPAEFNEDPTGLGEKLGLTILSQNTIAQDNGIGTQIKSAENTNENTNEESKNATAFSFREDEQTVTVAPQKGIEYKFIINKFDKLTYEWETTDGSDIYFDFHGEPEGDTTGYFESYGIATTHQVKGTVTVPFKGSHGWYWENSSDKEITIILKTSGNYLLKSQ